MILVCINRINKMFVKSAIILYRYFIQSWWPNCCKNDLLFLWTIQTRTQIVFSVMILKSDVKYFIIMSLDTPLSILFFTPFLNFQLQLLFLLLLKNTLFLFTPNDIPCVKKPNQTVCIYIKVSLHTKNFIIAYHAHIMTHF